MFITGCATKTLHPRVSFSIPPPPPLRYLKLECTKEMQVTYLSVHVLYIYIYLFHKCLYWNMVTSIMLSMGISTCNLTPRSFNQFGCNQLKMTLSGITSLLWKKTSENNHRFLVPGGTILTWKSQLRQVLISLAPSKESTLAHHNETTGVSSHYP